MKLAVRSGLGGVMVWEGGHDCRMDSVERDGKVHVVTCPNGKESSLFVSISRAIEKAGARRWDARTDCVLPIETKEEEL